MSKRRRNNPPPPTPPSNTEITRVSQSVSFSGPLPPPGLLAKYNEVITNGAERIMAMAERQSVHREGIERLVIEENIASQKRGSIFAFIICLVALLGGFYLIATGKNGYGLASIIGSLATLAGVFVYAKREQRKEREEKSAALYSKRQR